MLDRDPFGLILAKCRTLPDRTAVLAAGHPVVRQLLVGACRHWATEYCVDGFVFVNAENLTQVGGKDQSCLAMSRGGCARAFFPRSLVAELLLRTTAPFPLFPGPLWLGA